MTVKKIIANIQQLLEELQATHQTELHRLSSELRLANEALAQQDAAGKDMQKTATERPSFSKSMMRTMSRKFDTQKSSSSSNSGTDGIKSTSRNVNADYGEPDIVPPTRHNGIETMFKSHTSTASTARSIVAAQHTSSLSMVNAIEVEEIGDDSKALFALRADWLKLPDAAESFVEEVDRMLVAMNVNDMKDSVQQAMLNPERYAKKKRDSFQNILDYVPMACMINPSSQYRVMWDLGGTILISYDMVLIPFHIAYQPDAMVFTDVMGWTTLIFWTCDMVWSIFTGFYKDGVLVMDQKEIIVNYLKGWFWIDCIVVLPDWVMKAMGSATNFAGLGRILRMARFMRVLRLLRLLKLKKLFDVVYDIIDSEATFICFNLVKLLIVILFMNHMVACAWYFVGRTSKDAGAKKNWLQDVGYTPVWGRSLTWKYLTSLHWSITQFTPASMDISATNEVERLFSVIILFWALVALSSIIGSVSASMTALRNMSADENKQFWTLRRYLRQKKVGKDLSMRIFRYLEFQQVKTHNLVHPKNVKLLEALSQQFKEELAYELCGTYLESHPFFDHLKFDTSLKEAMNRICLSALANVLTAQHECVFAPGDEGQTMYFIKGGVYVYTLLDEVPLDEDLVPKHWVAEAVLWTIWRHRGWLKATMPSESFALNPKRFSAIIHLHPKPTYLAMHYGVDFVNYLNKMAESALSDVIFNAEVWRTTVKESDTYRLTQQHVTKSLSKKRIEARISIGSQATHSCESNSTSTHDKGKEAYFTAI